MHLQGFGETPEKRKENKSMQKLRAEKTSDEIQEINIKEKERKATLRSRETIENQIERNCKNKESMCRSRVKETSAERLETTSNLMREWRH